jgi:hypothetical protein
VAHSWGESGRLLDPAILGGWLAKWWSDELLHRPPDVATRSG